VKLRVFAIGLVLGIFLEGCAPPASSMTSTFHPGIPGASGQLAYSSVILADSPTYYWRLGDSGGALASDLVGGNSGMMQGTYTWGIPGALFGDPNTALTLTTNGYFYGPTSVAGPTIFSLELWFKTTTATGGKLIGFGNLQTGASSNYDRHIYMTNSGQIYFGCYPGGVQVATSPLSYNDGNWHYAAATLSTSGMILYIDGASVGTNAATTAQAYSGYWRVGYDSLTGWTAPPTSNFFNGTLDEAAVYMTKALTPTQILNHYNAGKN
jgi:hypothetical protein